MNDQNRRELFDFHTFLCLLKWKTGITKELVHVFQSLWFWEIMTLRILFLIYVSLSRRLASLSLFPRTIVVTAVILKPFIWNLCSRHITLNEASFNTIRRQLSNLRYLWNAHLVGGGAGDGWITPHTFYQPVVPNIINTFQCSIYSQLDLYLNN